MCLKSIITINKIIFLIFCGCFCLGGTLAAPQAQSGDTQSKTQTAVVRQQRKIERLSHQLAEEQRKLDTLLSASSMNPQDDVPAFKHKSALVMWITGAHQGINLGKKDGLRTSDRFIILERPRKVNMVAPEAQQAIGAPSQAVVKGYCYITQLYDEDSIIAAINNAGIRPEDEVYVLNRDDSPYSFANARY